MRSGPFMDDVRFPFVDVGPVDEAEVALGQTFDAHRLYLPLRPRNSGFVPEDLSTGVLPGTEPLHPIRPRGCGYLWGESVARWRHRR